MYLGVVVVVFGLALVHARYIGHYPFTGTSRFAWTVAALGVEGERRRCLCPCAEAEGCEASRPSCHVPGRGGGRLRPRPCPCPMDRPLLVHRDVAVRLDDRVRRDPERLRLRRRPPRAAAYEERGSSLHRWARRFGGALAISIVQLVVGDALLPRFVVFGAAILLPDWYRICARMAAGGRVRAEARDRVVLVASSEEAATLADELIRNPERPASIVAHLVPEDARCPRLVTGGPRRGGVRRVGRRSRS
jgi:hypothetical protein